MTRPEKILVRGLNWLGDAVMSLPAISALRKASPSADLRVLAHPRALEIYGLALEANKAISDQKGFWGRLNTFKALRDFKPDKTILLQNAFGAAALAFLARLPNRAGYARDGRGFLLNKAIKIAKKSRLCHEAFYYLDLLAALGIPAPYEAPRLNPPPRFLDSKISFEALGLPPQKGFWLALAPGAAYGEAKRYPARDFARIANLLAEKMAIETVAILGGPGEALATRETRQFLNEKLTALDLAGRTDLGQAMAVLSRCGLLVANDSGLSHLAGALSIPSATLFGPTNPLTTGPLAKKSLVLRKPSPCSPCRDRNCQRPRRICFEDLSPLFCAERILSFLGEPSPKGPAILRVLGGFYGDDALNATARVKLDPRDWENPEDGETAENKADFKEKAEIATFREKEREYLISLKKPNEKPSEKPEDEYVRRKAQKPGSFGTVYYMGDDLEFLAKGQNLGAKTILTANEKKPEIFTAALALNLTVAVPDKTRGLEWIADRELNVD
jgi:heptosyltransferase-2